MANSIDLTAEGLSTTAHKYRGELLQLPLLAIQDTLKHMNIRTGVRYKETVGTLTGDAQLGPYSDTRVDSSDLTVDARTLETFLGSVVKKFKPNDIYKSLWGSSITKGEGLKNVDIARQVLSFISAQIGKNLGDCLFTAVRKESGSLSKDLFNGFDTICKNDETSGLLSSAKGNLLSGSEAISSSNAVDVLKGLYRAASPELQSQPTKLFMSYDAYNAYVDDYQSTVGSVPYNQQFDKTYLEGSRNMCELVPLACKKDSAYFQLTTQSNMLVGCDQMSDLEQVEVEKHAPFVLDFIATMFFGVQFESVAKERFMAYKLATL